MTGRLDGKVALITGASRGIGRATALVFAREGAAVAVNYVAREADARQVVEIAADSGAEAIAVRADVARKDEVPAMVETVLGRFGKIDLLVNNAGIARRGTTLDLDEAELDEMLAVNLKGVIYGVRAVAPQMIERGYGKIVNIASVAGLGTALPNTTPYATTKASVIVLTKRLAMELGPHGINVNAICPGMIRTDMSSIRDDSPDLPALAQKAMLGRFGQPEDIARCALFLASDDASFVTAQILSVDGGRMDFLSSSG